MAITVKHLKVSTIPDAGDDSLIEPSDWNNDHVLTGTVPVANGGTGAATLTGYVKGNGISAMTADTTIPNTDVTGLGNMSTQNANSVAITGGTMSGVSVTGYIPTTEKGSALGVATLDSAGKVPLSQIPDSLIGALSYQGTWNATTNTPTLTSSVGTKGYYYVVSVAGTTNLNGITDWQIGDWAVYNGTTWQKIDNTDGVTSVNGLTGAVTLTTTNISEGTNLYYTDAKARASLSAGTGISYVSSTGVITNSAPDQTVSLANGTGINVTGTYPNFTVTNTSPSSGGTVTSVDASVPSFLSVSGNPVTTNGTLAIGYSGTALPIANGGTGGTSAGKALSNLYGATRTNSSVTQITLTNTSTQTQIIFGSTAQPIYLPVTSTLAVGWSFTISNNNSAGTVSVFSSGGISVVNIPIYVTAIITCQSITGASAADWSYTLSAAQYATGSQYSVYSQSPTFTGTVTLPSLNSNGTFALTNLSATGTVTLGSAAQTAQYTFGNSTVSQTISIANGATASGSTKTLQLGTGGLTGSTTAISIGSTFGSTTTANGAWTFTGIPTVNSGSMYINSGSTSTSGTLYLGDGTITKAPGSGFQLSSLLVSGNSTFQSASTFQSYQDNALGSATTPQIKNTGTSTGLYWPSTSSMAFAYASAKMFEVTGVASGVNYLSASQSATTVSPTLSALGSDTNISLSLLPKGTGTVKSPTLWVGANALLGGTTNPIISSTGSVNSYIQNYIYNANAGVSASSDFVSYSDNSTDSHGWADMGFTSSAYADSVYTVTGPNEAYLFGSAPSGAGKTGNLVYATDSTGSANAHQFYVGGFTQAKAAWKAQIDTNGLSATQLNATNGIVCNSNTIAANFTIPTGSNAMSAGPITINTGITVTVPTGSTWVVV